MGCCGDNMEVDSGAAGSPPLGRLKQEKHGCTWQWTGQEASPKTARDPSPYKGWTLRWPDPFASLISIR